MAAGVSAGQIAMTAGNLAGGLMMVGDLISLVQGKQAIAGFLADSAFSWGTGKVIGYALDGVANGISSRITRSSGELDASKLFSATQQMD